MDDTEKPSLPQDDDDFPPPRRGTNPLVVLGIIVLIALVIGGGIFALLRLTSGNSNTAVAPTATLVPGSNLFYVQATPEWGTLLVDGQTIAHVPTSSSQPPLVLSAGVHEVVWQADPFMPQHCTIVVPPIVSETLCLSNDPMLVNAGPNKGLPAYVIIFNASLNKLAAVARTNLLAAVQATLDSLQASDTVQSGEHYVDLNAGPPNYIATATVPLKATLHFNLDTNTSSPNPCAVNFVGSSCYSHGEDCHTFCTAQEQPGIAPSNRWDVSAVVKVSWDYTAPGGQLVAQNQPDENDNTGTEYEIELYLTWSGGHWHVATEAANLPATPPGCLAAYFVSSQGHSFFAASANPTSPVYWNAQVGTNPASGCLLLAYPLTNSPTPVANPQPIARVLYRFGVPLALDTATHNDWPAMPVANAYEQSIAQQIQAGK
jgi:hypothetical protein